MKFTLVVETTGDPRAQSAQAAAALRKVADLIEPWGRVYEGGREITDAGGVKVGRWEAVDD